MCLLTNFCLLSFTDGGHPTASQSVSLGFNGTKNARAFAHQIGKPMRVSRGQLNTGRKLLQSSSPSPTDIAYKTLASAINASSSAQEGTVAVKQVGSEWHFGFSRQHACLPVQAYMGSGVSRTLAVMHRAVASCIPGEMWRQCGCNWRVCHVKRIHGLR